MKASRKRKTPSWASIYPVPLWEQVEICVLLNAFFASKDLVDLIMDYNQDKEIYGENFSNRLLPLHEMKAWDSIKDNYCYQHNDICGDRAKIRIGICTECHRNCCFIGLVNLAVCHNCFLSSLKQNQAIQKQKDNR